MGCKIRLVLALLTVAVPILGCTAARRYPPSGRVSSTDLVFNPQLIVSTGNDIRRSEWPVAIGDKARHEYADYRETIIDRQGNFFGHGNTYYRRFESTRVGRSHR
ncbi:MAG: hypothetical protein IIB60_06075 [Planctomycetes bacterium]|nr:hypothetical protein [Planctomycetota bacterium]MCH8966905.1 hypothetical protein [Planctomycetota bacterium]